MKQGEDAVVVLLNALNDLGVEYMVVGSFSSNRYGIPRATKDADFVLKMGKDERERLFSRLPAGFKIDPQVSFEMITGTWRQIIEVPEVPFIIELFELSRDAHDQSRFSRRRKLSLVGTQAWLPSAEDVVIQKLRWCIGGKRSKDFEDAIAVIGVQGQDGLDWNYIEKWCGEHGTLEILAQAKSDAAPAWEEDDGE
jgi:hypothetical protein